MDCASSRFLGCGCVAGCGAVWLLEIYPRHGSHPPLRLAKGTLAIEHARIYVSPADPPIEDGTVLVSDGAITALGPQVAVPAGAQILPCDHCIVTAGFWHTHVHFAESKWSMAQWKSTATLNPQLAPERSP
jgi:imidazolonepropionase-like amidohydrolase